jgi:hypothetical protein
MALEYIDRLPPGWFVIGDAIRQKSRGADWVALIVDFDPDDRYPGIPAARMHAARQRWLRIRGRHRSRESAQHALQDMTVTRH